MCTCYSLFTLPTVCQCECAPHPDSEEHFFGAVRPMVLACLQGAHDHLYSKGKFGLSGIVSCDAAAVRIRIRIVRCQLPAKRQKHKHCETQTHFLPPLLLVGSKELVLKVPKRGQFHTAIRVTRKRSDSCAQVAQGTRTVSRRNF